MISMVRLNATLRDARTFVFPTECAGCGNPDVRVCTLCAELLRAQPRLVPFVGSPAQAPARAQAQASLPVLSCGEYGEPFARVLHAFKDAGRTGLAHDLAPRLRAGLAEFEARVPLSGPLSVSVPPVASAPDAPARPARPAPSARFVAPPSTLANRRARGFEPLELIARHAQITLWHPLEAARRREDQATLGVSARAHNMHGSMRVRGNLAGASVILIDDLMTTGSTLMEMTRALVAAGAHVRGAVVLAHAERRWPATRHSHL